MAKNRKNSGLWAWILIGVLVAAIAMGILYYIGWFNNNTHVDAPNGDDVKENYEIKGREADQPGVQSWQNTKGENLIEVIVDSSSTYSGQTPPTSTDR